MKPPASEPKTAPVEIRNASGGNSAVNHLRRKSHPAKIAAARQNAGSTAKNSAIQASMPAVDGAFPTIRAWNEKHYHKARRKRLEAVMIISRLWALINASISDIVVLLLVGLFLQHFIIISVIIKDKSSIAMNISQPYGNLISPIIQNSTWQKWQYAISV